MLVECFFSAGLRSGDLWRQWIMIHIVVMIIKHSESSLNSPCLYTHLFRFLKKLHEANLHRLFSVWLTRNFSFFFPPFFYSCSTFSVHPRALSSSNYWSHTRSFSVLALSHLGSSFVHSFYPISTFSPSHPALQLHISLLMGTVFLCLLLWLSVSALCTLFWLLLSFDF